MYAPNTGQPKYVKQILMDIKGEINSNTVIVEECNSSFTSMDRSFRQTINTEMAALHDTLDQMNLVDIFREFHSKAEEYAFFSSAHGTCSRIDHM